MKHGSKNKRPIAGLSINKPKESTYIRKPESSFLMKGLEMLFLVMVTSSKWNGIPCPLYKRF